MVELDVGKKESAQIEVAARRWARKLGRVDLGSLNKDMYEAHSIATRKRSVPSLEESIKSIQLDENNDIKLTAKVLKLFFFFWDKNANLATEAVIAETVGPKEASQAPTAPVSEIPARITEAPVSEHLKFSEIPARITEEKYFFLSQWPAQIKKSVQQIEDLAAALFPYEGDIRYVQWRNKAGYRMQKKRIAQLFYPYFLGRQRDPYKCSACKQYGHNKDSSICPVKLQS